MAKTLSTRAEAAHFAKSLFPLCEAYLETDRLLEASGFSAVSIKEREIESFALTHDELATHRAVTIKSRKELLSRTATHFGEGRVGERHDYVSPILARLNAEVSRNKELSETLSSYGVFNEYDPCERNRVAWMIKSGLSRQEYNKTRSHPFSVAIGNNGADLQVRCLRQFQCGIASEVERFMSSSLTQIGLPFGGGTRRSDSGFEASIGRMSSVLECSYPPLYGPDIMAEVRAFSAMTLATNWC